MDEFVGLRRNKSGEVLVFAQTVSDFCGRVVSILILFIDANDWIRTVFEDALDFRITGIDLIKMMTFFYLINPIWINVRNSRDGASGNVNLVFN